VDDRDATSEPEVSSLQGSLDSRASPTNRHSLYGILCEAKANATCKELHGRTAWSRKQFALPSAGLMWTPADQQRCSSPDVTGQEL